MPFQAPDMNSALQRIGRLLRNLHDASAEYIPPDDAVWNIVIPGDRCDLIVHHDAAPWNLVLNPDRWVFIDWDATAPGSRLWDLAYAAHGFISLAPGTFSSAAGRLLAALADGYGLTGEQRVELSALLGPRIWSMHRLLAHGHSNRIAPWARLCLQGHGQTWQADTEYVEQNNGIFLAALLNNV